MIYRNFAINILSKGLIDMDPEVAARELVRTYRIECPGLDLMKLPAIGPDAELIDQALNSPVDWNVLDEVFTKYWRI